MIDFTIEGSRELHFKKNKPYGMRYAKKHTNPHYLDSRAFQENCQRCVMTYELLRRGYNVEAKPKENDYWSDCAHWPELFSKDSPKRDKIMWFGDIEVIKKRIQDGERWAIMFQYKDFNDGHAFVAERHGERLYSIDPQNGETGVLSTYWEKSRKEMYGIRLDDKTFTEKMKEICFER